MLPPAGIKNYSLRSTNEEVEVIDYETPSRGERSEGDWVTYIDSKGKEHIKGNLNIQLDFKSLITDTFNSILKGSAFKHIPTIRNARIYKISKELFLQRSGRHPETIVEMATDLVDRVGIEEMSE